ncbi:MAG: phosphoribosylformylglycinamidine synthase subunit PurQ [Bacillota bacterium]
MRCGIVTFPGSNCDQDCYHVTANLLAEPTDMLWYQEEKDLSEYDLIILPGGFSYGDYLRSGAIARFAPMMEAVIEYAQAGGLVLGICNGFQILLEAGLLPGAMKVNQNLKFTCQDVELRVVNPQTPFTNHFQAGERIKIPVAHREGNYYIDQSGLEELITHNQIVVQYSSSNENPNGSLNNIAGICNRDRNILGLMPHPERACEELLGSQSEDGYRFFTSVIEYLTSGGECSEY